MRWWAEQRLRRSVARDLENNTLHGAVRQMIRAGLPITAVLIAVHPIWGFSWYFNSENWATAAWQKIAESRVDDWRERDDRGGGAGPRRGQRHGDPACSRSRRAASATAIFRSSSIGDPGEGDPSQHALRDQVLLAARRDDVKFVVIASDVVYPVGAMKDYEPNFYLPLKGIEKPVFAIPGNHDWFNALDGFAANLMDRRDGARRDRRARQSDLSLSSTTAGSHRESDRGRGASARPVSSAGRPPVRAVLRAACRGRLAHRDRYRHRSPRRSPAARMADRRIGSLSWHVHRSRFSATRSTPRADRRSARVRSRTSTICCGRAGCT